MKTNPYALLLLASTSLCSPSCKEKAAETQETVAVEEAPAEKVEKEVSPSIRAIENAHNKEGFLAKETVSFGIQVSFGGKERINGTMTLQTNSARGVLALNDGNKIYTIGEEIHYSPEMEDEKAVKFDAFTWSYFFSLPYKLSDPGTQWSEKEMKEYKGEPYAAQKLTFASGTGDTPEDWYWVFTDPEEHRIEMSTYIVTAGATKEEAEANPHTITYESYESVEGIPIAMQWRFWGWEEEKGTTDQIGEASLRHVTFAPMDEKVFAVPEGFKKLN